MNAAPKLSNLSKSQKDNCRDVCLKGNIGYSETDDNKYLIRSGIFVVTIIDDKNIYVLRHLLLGDHSFNNIMGEQ